MSSFSFMPVKLKRVLVVVSNFQINANIMLLTMPLLLLITLSNQGQTTIWPVRLTATLTKVSLQLEKEISTSARLETS